MVLRLCAQILGKWTCKTTTMLADPDNKASLSEGAIRLQLPLGVDYYSDVPPMSSIGRYNLVNAMQKALSAYFGIDDYRLLMRDFTPTSTPLSGLDQNGLDAKGIGAYATFDVLPKGPTGRGSTPESIARSLQVMLDDPTGTSPFYHEKEANTATLRAGYALFQTLVPVRGATLTELAADGTFSARVPPPSPPPPSYPPVPASPPPRGPPPPPSPWVEAKHVVRLAFVVSGTVDTFDSDAFAESLATLLGTTRSAVSLVVAAASVRVTAAVNANSAADATSLVATLGALTPTAASASLGVTIESVEEPVACDSSSSGSEGCGDEATSTKDGTMMTVAGMELGTMAVGLIGGGAALLVILCICACLCCCVNKNQREQMDQEDKLKVAVSDNKKKMAKVQVAMEGKAPTPTPTLALEPTRRRG